MNNGIGSSYCEVKHACPTWIPKSRSQDTIPKGTSQHPYAWWIDILRIQRHIETSTSHTVHASLSWRYGMPAVHGTMGWCSKWRPGKRPLAYWKELVAHTKLKCTAPSVLVTCTWAAQWNEACPRPPFLLNHGTPAGHISILAWIHQKALVGAWIYMASVLWSRNQGLV